MRVTPSMPSSYTMKLEGLSYQMDQPHENEQSTQREKVKVDLEKIIDKIQEQFSSNQTYIKVQMHKGTNTIMVRIIDNQTDEVLREIPPEKLLDLAYESWKRIGLFVDKRM